MTERRQASPYVGLVPFDEDDYCLYFGRDRDIARVIANLFGPRLTLLYGHSGVGKSSLINAGVLHEANQGTQAIGAVFRDWSQGDRFDRIAGEVHDRVDAFLSNSEHDTVPSSSTTDGEIASDLSSSLEQAAGRVDAQIMVVLDQFEDYFLYVPADDVESDRALSKALRSGPGNISFLIAIREDALSLLDRFKGMIPGLFDNYLRLDPLDRESAREAITKPLEVFRDADDNSWEIEERLVSRILDDLEGSPEWGADRWTAGRDSASGFEGALLQLVMKRLWSEGCEAPDRTLRVETFDQLRGSRSIVSDYLDKVMERLSVDQRRLAFRVFRELVSGPDDKTARRLQHLAERTFADPDDMRVLLSTLTDGRLLRVVDREKEVYEVFHDILARAVYQWCKRYERDHDPSAPTKRSQRQRLEVAAKTASASSADQSAEAVRTLADLCQTGSDNEIRERAEATLRRLAKGAKRYSPLDPFATRQGIQSLAEEALVVVRIGQLGGSIDASAREMQAAATSSDNPGDIRKDAQEESLVEGVERAAESLTALIDSPTTWARSSARSQVATCYYQLSEAVHVVDMHNPERFHAMARLTPILEQWQSVVDSDEVSGEFWDQWPDEPDFRGAEVPLWQTWFASALGFLFTVVLSVGTLGVAEWIADAWLDGWGRYPPSGVNWVLGSVGVVVGLFAGLVAYVMAEDDGLWEGVGVGVLMGSLVLLALGVAWILGSVAGLMFYQTFHLSLTWSTYVSTLAVVLAVSGMAKAGS